MRLLTIVFLIPLALLAQEPVPKPAPTVEELQKQIAAEDTQITTLNMQLRQALAERNVARETMQSIYQRLIEKEQQLLQAQEAKK